MTYNTIGIIPARANSKRILNKNIKLLCEYPLIAYSIVAAKMSKLIDRVIVTTDSVEISAIASIYGADEIVMRPPETATDTATDMDWMNHFLDYCINTMRYYPENIVILRPTSPLRKENLIDEAIYSLDKDATGLRSVSEIPEAVEKCFKIEKNTLVPAVPYYQGLKMIYGTNDITNLPNQTFSKSYTGNGIVDIVKSSTVINDNSLYGNKIQSFITDRNVDIDTLEDWEYAEYLINTKGHWINELLRRKDYRFLSSRTNER